MKDYFEHYEELPANVKEIIENQFSEDMDYNDCRALVATLETVGWTCDFDLSATCFDLRPLNSDKYV